MRLKLGHKLFIINSGIIIALAVAFICLSHYTSKSMNSNALNGIDLDVLEHLASTLGEHYRKEGSWDAYRNNEALWRKTADDAFYFVFFSLMAEVAKESGQGFAPPPENPNWEFPFGTFFQRLSLLDGAKTPLINAQIFNADATYQKIKRDGEVVGWLRIGKINIDMLPLAKHFFSQQLHIVYWSLGIGGLIAAALSYFLSRHITAPIKTLTSGAERIAQRDFKTFITVNTGDELQDLAASFNSISRQLDLYQTRQKEWLMSVSHELKTPLTLLVGEVFAICDNLSKCDDKTAGFLQQEVEHIKRMADDLHQLAQFDEPGFHLKRKLVELKPFLEYQVRRYVESFKGRHILLHESFCPESLYAEVDADRLAQVFSNLFENCLRYMASQGELWVRMRREERDVVVLEVEDSGPGVSAQSLAKLFERHGSPDLERRAAGGAGLGLSICREIVVAHGGEISAHTGHLGGLCVAIRLRLAEGESE